MKQHNYLLVVSSQRSMKLETLTQAHIKPSFNSLTSSRVLLLESQYLLNQSIYRTLRT